MLAVATSKIMCDYRHKVINIKTQTRPELNPHTEALMHAHKTSDKHCHGIYCWYPGQVVTIETNLFNISYT